MLNWLDNIVRAQRFSPGDLAIIALLVLLEGVLSIDNALVLGLQVRRLPAELRRKALTYGLAGAMILRLIAIALAAWLLRTQIVKLLGGAYLLFLAARHFLKSNKASAQHHTPRERESAAEFSAGGAGSEKTVSVQAAAVSPTYFWWTVIGVELSDLAFAIDSILAAIAMISGREGGAGGHEAAPPDGSPPIHPKLWVVVVGGMLGVILMRFAAALFIRLIDRYPRFESAAYLLVAIVGAKLLCEWAADFAHVTPLDFQSPRSIAFWIYWMLMALAVVSGFFKRGEINSPRSR